MKGRDLSWFLLGANIAMAWATYQMGWYALTGANLFGSLIMIWTIFWGDFDEE
jgi:hypothetical protein